jgi:hypothetical protein
LTTLFTALTLTASSMAITNNASAKPPIPLPGRGGPIPSGNFGHRFGHYGHGFGGVVVGSASETCKVWTRRLRSWLHRRRISVEANPVSRGRWPVLISTVTAMPRTNSGVPLRPDCLARISEWTKIGRFPFISDQEESSNPQRISKKKGGLGIRRRRHLSYILGSGSKSR